MENTIVRPIEVITQEINFYKQTAGAAVLEIGKRLNEAKAQLAHGEWTEWLESKVEFSEASAQRFMRLANEYLLNPSPVTDLGASKALILLALPEEERESFISEKHEIDGEEKSVLDMSKRELEKAVKERNDAIHQAELAAKDVEELKKKLKYTEMEIEHHKEEVQKAKEELEELKNKPIEVAIQPLADVDMGELKKQAAEEKEAEIEKLKKKIDKLTASEKKAKETADKAKKEIEDVKTAQDKTLSAERETNKRLAERVEELNKKLAVQSDGDMSEFKAYFENAKYSINKMLAIVGKNEENKKLSAPLKAFCEAVLKNLEV